MKHILIVQGGGRANGNTARLAESFARGAESADFWGMFCKKNG
ncbi:MAG: hypothetical protein ACLU8D_03165 [Enterocloster sp.]